MPATRKLAKPKVLRVRLAEVLLLAGAVLFIVARGTTQRDPDPSAPNPMPGAVSADSSWRRSLPGAAPSHLKYLGAWNANEYPNYPIRFLNLGLQDAFQFLGPTGTDPDGPVLDEGALRQAVASAAAGQAVLVRVEHVFFGQNMPYNHLCGDVKPAWCNYLSCMCAVGNSTSGPLSHWRSRWAALRVALAPFIENGTVKGVQMGDELLGQCLSLVNLTSAVELVRSSWPEAIIYVNEAIGPTVWDRNYCNRTVRNGWHGPVGTDDPPELGRWRFPSAVDLVGVDMQGCTYQPGICARYNVSHAVAADPTACPNESIWFNDCMSEKGEDADDCGVPQRCARLLRTWHSEHIYKRFAEGSNTRALFTPSAWVRSSFFNFNATEFPRLPGPQWATEKTTLFSLGYERTRAHRPALHWLDRSGGLGWASPLLPTTANPWPSAALMYQPAELDCGPRAGDRVPDAILLRSLRLGQTVGGLRTGHVGLGAE